LAKFYGGISLGKRQPNLAAAKTRAGLRETFATVFKAQALMGTWSDWRFGGDVQG